MNAEHREASCTICSKLAQWRTNGNPYLVHEFEHSVFVIGEHQYHRGYAQVILKQHACDLHELPHRLQAAFFEETMLATQALVKTFAPAKMNHSCYGNLDPHLHWHLFPRYADDPDRQKQPWLHASRFPGQRIDDQTAHDLVARVRVNLTPRQA